MRSALAAPTPRRVLILAAFALSTLALVPRPAPAATNASTLLKAAEVAPLVGGSPACKSSPNGTGCTWTGARPRHKVLVLTYPAMKGVPPETIFMGARQQAAAGGDAKPADEAGIGERAFSVQTSFGAVFMTLKQGRLLQLQYHTGVQGTSADVAALRPIMRKAAAAF